MKKKTFLPIILISFINLNPLTSTSLHAFDDPTPHSSSSKAPSHYNGLSLRKVVKALATLSLFSSTVTAHQPPPRQNDWLTNVTLPDWAGNATTTCQALHPGLSPINGSIYWDTFNPCVTNYTIAGYKDSAAHDDKAGLVAKYGLSYYYTRGVEGILSANPTEAVRLLRESAEGGYDEAQFSLGRSLYRSNLTASVEWMTKAALQHYAAAGSYLAIAYLTPSSVGIDEEKAVDLFRAATTMSLGSTQYTFGTYFEQGFESILRNITQAIIWFQRAINSTDARAQLKMSKYYYDGVFLAKNDSASFELAKSSAEQDEDEAQLILGDKYRTGSGTAVNASQTVRLYTRLVTDRSFSPFVGQAAYVLGQIYETGMGEIPQNTTLARRFYISAAFRHISGAHEKVLELGGYSFS